MCNQMKGHSSRSRSYTILLGRVVCCLAEASGQRWSYWVESVWIFFECDELGYPLFPPDPLSPTPRPTAKATMIKKAINPMIKSLANPPLPGGLPLFLTSESFSPRGPVMSLYSGGERLLYRGKGMWNKCATGRLGAVGGVSGCIPPCSSIGPSRRGAAATRRGGGDPFETAPGSMDFVYAAGEAMVDVEGKVMLRCCRLRLNRSSPGSGARCYLAVAAWPGTVAGTDLSFAFSDITNARRMRRRECVHDICSSRGVGEMTGEAKMFGGRCRY
jgi:hypothetical protein